MSTALQTRDIWRTYRRGKVDVPALRGVDLEIREGEWVAIVGPSGSGKSTLLNILGLLDRPDRGTYQLAGQDTAGMTDRARTDLRNQTIGFVFQQFNLLPRTTALDNVAAPLLYRRVGRTERRKRAREALEHVGLASRVDHDPNELSGGQMQRVAIARALVGDPTVLLIDEPTGNLDGTATAEILNLLAGLHDEGRTIVMITHEAGVADHADRRILLRDGQIVDNDTDVHLIGAHDNPIHSS